MGSEKMAYSAMSFIAILIFSLVHLFANKMRNLDTRIHSKFLSLCGGVAIAYVFIDLLPKLSEGDLIVKQAMTGFFSFFEKHAYVMALAGFLLFFSLDKASTVMSDKRYFWLSLLSYSLFNCLVGYAVADEDNPEVRPLAFFTVAMAFHYFTNDYTLSEEHGLEYQRKGKWILIASLLLGWCVGTWFVLSLPAVALVSAFIGGGVIMNVTRHELPNENPNNLPAFILSSLLYTILLLSIG